MAKLHGSELSERLAAGDTRAVARSMRWVDGESSQQLSTLLHDVYRLASQKEKNSKVQVVGITGAPGAGKSTLLDAWIRLCRSDGHKVGVIAVDPSSPITGGAVLGDRIRMQHHFLDEGVFIRSLANRGAHGGLSTSTQDAIAVLVAAGFQRIFVETMGVGQGEFDVTNIADTTVLVVPPGLGDDVQAIKAGVLEVADIFVVNKADKDGALIAARDLEMMIQLGFEVLGERRTADMWVPPVLKTVASEQKGLKVLEESCQSHSQWLNSTASGQRRKHAQMHGRLRRMVERSLWERLGPRVTSHLPAGIRRIAEGHADIVSATETIVAQILVDGAGV